MRDLEPLFLGRTFDDFLFRPQHSPVATRRDVDLAMPLVPVAVSAVALLFGAGILRLRGAFFALATIGVNQAVQQLVINFEPWGGATGIYLSLDSYAPFGGAMLGSPMPGWAPGSEPASEPGSPPAPSSAPASSAANCSSANAGPAIQKAASASPA